MTLQKAINKYNTNIEIIDQKLEESQKQAKKLERKVLLMPSNQLAFVKWYIEISTVEKLLELKRILMKEINRQVEEIKNK